MIIGKLIPAGAGLGVYRDMAESLVPEEEPAPVFQPEQMEAPVEEPDVLSEEIAEPRLIWRTERSRSENDSA